MEHIEAAIYHAELVDVPAGIVTWQDAAGAKHEAEFMVRTVANPNTSVGFENPDAASRRENDFNAQYVALDQQLEREDCTLLSFRSAKPDPFF